MTDESLKLTNTSSAQNGMNAQRMRMGMREEQQILKTSQEDESLTTKQGC
jgi:hypothetical protein